MSEETRPVISAEDAKKVLAEELKKREEACAKELNDVLVKHGFTMKFIASPVLVEVAKQ